MILNGINFPNELLEALQEKRVVVFAGAGVSMGAPTSLPNFEDLAKKIAEETGETKDKKDLCEVFLGHLKSKDIDVNQKAANLLSSHCLCHNEMHEVIISLFTKPSDIKIVTTNYDEMFEQVIAEKKEKVPVFNAPALPLGDDIAGIIHVHGNIDNPKYMVLTDEDFGRAYLTDGYAAKFLISLFQSYVILFVGYSYKDTIMRYLTRAIARNVGPKKYILTDDDEVDWNALDIIPIHFEKGDYGTEKEGLKKLGQRAKRGLLDWKDQFEEYSDHPPKDLSLETEIDYILTNIEKVRILADCINGTEWLEVLDRKGVFKSIFSAKGDISEFDRVWLNWIIDKIVGKEDSALEKLLLIKGNQLHPEFVAAMLQKIKINNPKMSDEYLCKYIILLGDKISSSCDIFRLIEVCVDRGLFVPCQDLFAKFFNVSFVLESRFWPGMDLCTYKHRMNGEQCQIQKAWELCKENFLSQCPERWLFLSRKVICELHNKYLLLGIGPKGNDPWQMAMLVIEYREDFLDEDPLRFICDIFIESCTAYETKNPILLKEFLITCLNKPSVLLKKVALKALRKLVTISADEKFDIFIQNSSISFCEGKEQVFLLIKDIFGDISESRKNLLIDLIEGIDEYNGKTHNEYAKYNWCVWIKRFCTDNERINALEEDILSRNDFAPRNHPERSIESESFIWVEDKSPFNQTEMMQLAKDKVIYYLENYNENQYDGPSRTGLLKVFTACCKDDFCWASNIASLLIDRRLQKEDVWTHLIQGVQDSDVSICEHISFLERMTENVEIIRNDLTLARFLWEILQNSAIKDKFSDYEDCLFKMADTLWENRGSCDENFERLIDASLNTTLGNILMSYVYMLSYREHDGIPIRYKQVFEKNLQLEGYERSIAICILTGHFNYFCLRDLNWSTEHLLPTLKSEYEKDFSAAWEGVVFFSRHLNKDVADVVAPIYLEAVTHIAWLSREVSNGFIDLYLVLMMYVIDNPCQLYIPTFYKYASENDRKQFVKCIEYRLKNAESDFKNNWWNSWLKQYLVNRFKNIPVPLTDSEYEIIMNWLPEASEFFPEAVNIVCAHNLPAVVDTLFLYKLEENKLVEMYPHEVIRLLTVLLNGGTDFQYFIDNVLIIYKAADGLTEEEKRAFQEACLKRNIKI